MAERPQQNTGCVFASWVILLLVPYMGYTTGAIIKRSIFSKILATDTTYLACLVGIRGVFKQKLIYAMFELLQCCVK